MITESFVEDAIWRLYSLGFETDDEDETIMQYAANKSINYVKDNCNINEIPYRLKEAVTDMICGEFLMVKKSSGSLDDAEIDCAIKQIQEGDTGITYAFGEGLKTPEARLDALIEYFLSVKNDSLAKYRRMIW